MKGHGFPPNRSLSSSFHSSLGHGDKQEPSPHQGARRISVVRWVVGSILQGGPIELFLVPGARCSSMVRAFTHGAMDHQIDPSGWTH